MANFKPVLRTTGREFHPVYIRISHKSHTDYIRTSMIAHKSQLRNNEIIDRNILANTHMLIKSYILRLNEYNIDNWSVSDVKNYLTTENQSIKFSEFARHYIDKMHVDGRLKSANNYSVALRSFLNFAGEHIAFTDITSNIIKEWINSLLATKRAKSMYPSIIKTLYNEGCLNYNNYDKNIIKIPNQPFRSVKIPNNDVPRKRAISAEELIMFFSTTPVTASQQMAQDVGKIIFYLMGINAVDIYHLPTSAVKGGKLCYNRRKTKDRRADKAYIEVDIHDDIMPLFKTYRGVTSLFIFNSRFSKSDYFTEYVNNGLKELCAIAGITPITTYWLRHTWATIARNQCGASVEEVGYCLNHASAHAVTDGYITQDFSHINRINTKVINYLFNQQINNC